MSSDPSRLSRLRAIPLAGPALARACGLLAASPLGRALAPVARMERVTLAVVAFAALAIYAFAVLAGEVLEGDTGRLDRTILLALRNPRDLADPLGPVWLEEVMRDLTALGGTTVLTLVTLAVIAYLLLVRRRATALLVAASVLGATVLASLLKWGFDRPRPDLVPHGVAVYSQSFPSSHAMLSAAIYLTLGALLARSQERVRVKVFLLGVAVLVTVLVGASRIYLGVHWPTDVLGGWAVGAAWASGSWLVMLWLQRRGEVEAEAPAAPPRA
ncbi:phosphatase PAP2 family protein [Xanthobacter pseudotagetidis]|uniref:phosphatase PAP2 family protein n=1 Tax=Xanthobacter pseudotagetidis TaxID=3119911 RepID=UPI003728C7A3